MKHETVRANAFAMPLTNPAFPSGPYRFVNREYFIIQYRTDPDALRRIVPEPLELAEPVVNYEFIRMPDSTGFGDYTESGQVIPVSSRAGRQLHPSMFLNDHPPIAGGRELWGFPKKLAQPKLARRNRHAGRYAELRLGPRRDRHHGLQAPRSTQRRAEARWRAELPAQDHPARRRHAAHLRTGATTISKTSRSRAHGPGRRRSTSTRMPGSRRRAAGTSSASAKHVIADLTLGLGNVVHDYLTLGAAVRRRGTGSEILIEANAG